MGLLEKLVAQQELEVLKYDIKTRDKDGLLWAKCEAYGARRLLVSLQQHIKSLRVAASNAKGND